jgi:ubiquinone/menaquinone biosynthesis C-methylase UbiE
LTPEMLLLAQQRAVIEGQNVRFLQGDIAHLPFPDAYFDLVTGSYALRNAPDLAQTIEELGRVLRSGGVLAILDFAKPEHPALQKLQQWLLAGWGGLWGMVLHRDPKVHSYIGASLCTYSPQPLVVGLLEERDLSLWKREKFMFGAIEILLLQKAQDPVH